MLRRKSIQHGEALTGASTKQRVSREILIRGALVTLFAVIAHQFSWMWLRSLTSGAILGTASLLHLNAYRFSADTIRIEGVFFQFVIACTFVDVFLGAVPLLWNRRKAVFANLARLAIVAVTFFAFNIVRLTVALLLFARAGLSWTTADSLIAGCAYTAVWIAIWKMRSWNVLEPKPVSAERATTSLGTARRYLLLPANLIR